MTRTMERLRRAIWVFNQPLTAKPNELRTPVSDLFVWRNSNEWKTYFELMDISGLFENDQTHFNRYVTLYFFDNNGSFILDKRAELAQWQRKTIDLSAYLYNVECQHGTFCVFHSHTPEVVGDLGSFLTERGYVSYCYKDAPLRTYVHGNLDAISLPSGRPPRLLGSSSYLKREYKLQHELKYPAQYEIGIVNTSPHTQKIYCHAMSTKNNETLSELNSDVPPKGSVMFQVKTHQEQASRVVIKSHLVMARPLVFRFNQQKLDVFHG